MCGIVGAIAQRNVTPILMEGLIRLEYRGYDSAGIGIISENNQLKRARVEGKVKKLVELLKTKSIKGNIGIAHTRWATHGKPCVKNAHPHISKDNLAVVHNGIIENYKELRTQLIKDGYKFTSDTDTEVIAHLINRNMSHDDNLLKAMQRSVKKLDGAYALAVINNREPNRLIAVRSGSPLVIGIGIEEYFLASDSLALLPVAQKFIYLTEGDMADITLNGVTIYNAEHNKVDRPIVTTTVSHKMTERGKYRHYMEKEVFEQPEAIFNTLNERLGKTKILHNAFGKKSAKIFPAIKRIQIVACGTSYHAGLVAKHWLEEIINLPTNVDIASEFRYRRTIVEPETLFVTISQSGETADTLEALRKAKKNGYKSSLTICNVAESSLVRESDMAFLTNAGPEIGVASTKAFTTQLTALLMLSIALGHARGTLTSTREKSLIQQLLQLPDLITKTLKLNKKIQQLSELFANKQHAFFLGRGIHFPIAMEGSLKLKEISYIHAESYPAGELKHGPLALIDQNMPVIVIAPDNALLEKLISNIHEVHARGGKLIVFTDGKLNLPAEEHIITLEMPKSPQDIAPIVHTIPLQLLAYHVAIIKGTDVDQPRNLAKSVTVE